MTNKIKATLITWLMCLALLATISAAYLINIQGRTLFKLPNQATVLVEVKSGSNVVQLLKQMNQRDYLTDTGVLRKLWLKTNPNLSQIKAGWYQLSHDQSLVSWLSEVAKGEVITHKITLVEGQTLWEWLAKMSSTGLINIDVKFDEGNFRYTDLTGRVWSEGTYLPETYQFTHLASATSILRQAKQAQVDTLNQLLSEYELPELIPSKAQWITLASIIEKETGAAHEREHIAGVFLNRLSRNMRLQTDPTVIYGIGPSFDGDITREHLKTPTPFNTYTMKGLPPSPIAAPSKAALESVLKPLATQDLYFVAKGNGEHHFSETLQEHNQAVRQYQLNKTISKE
jgi:UPF0755 protein